ncbi:ACP S-malonyltransferase [Hyphomonas oceanitis]|uniref:Malonyl CoA-acyl carrier protein transacylase n=1 Tax=Hyphomonas oceanitis SCH89 TaxID=1280953 RepID=A0A059GAC1_9PROT|nr:ACP S-malonyltransferase [Hyphomonas oceanitis]KDA03797.1 malonyl CoA-acyl carrier protein transacylase [Hyphomonas oceanitis SCH89]
MTGLAFIFPGQGSQEIGMGKALADAFPAAKAVFAEVDEALGQNLSDLMWNGDIADLTLTANTQPALMAHSVAAMRALEAEFGLSAAAAMFVAGHSLGEYSALASAGAISLADTARLLRIRGNAMQGAVAPGEGAMAALLGADVAQAEAACVAGREAGGVCELANDNAPGQLVLSGSTAAVEAACAHAKENGVKKAMLLNVSAPFHCSLMQPAADAMAEALAGIEIKAPVVPVVANISASPTSDPDTIRKNLIDQVTGRVRWTESVQFMVGKGVTTTGEAGAGKVLTVMQRRIEKSLNGFTLGTPEDLEAFAAAIKGEAHV